MEYFRNRLGVGPDVHIAYLVRQGTCTQEKLQTACKGLTDIANECDTEATSVLPQPGAQLWRQGLNALVKIGALQPLIMMMAHRMSHHPVTRAMAAECAITSQLVAHKCAAAA